MKLFSLSKNKAFTLIELLVVISIISLLSSVVFTSVNTARAKSRDARRMSELLQIQRAVELYYDKKGCYPGAVGCTEAYYYNYTPYGGSGCGYPYPPNWPSGVWCHFESALQPYISSLPRDTLGPTVEARYKYKYNENTKKYALSVRLENATPQSQNDGGFYPDYFEIGPLPSYCKSQYNLDWNTWDYACSCGTGATCQN